MLWQDLQETFYLVFAPCLAGVVLPFFVAFGIGIAIYRAATKLVPYYWSSRKNKPNP